MKIKKFHHKIHINTLIYVFVLIQIHMSQFVEVKNQNTLWNLSHKIPEFSSMNRDQQDILFKKTISRIYDTVGNRDITPEQLKTLNKQALSHLVSQFRKNTSETMVSVTAQPQPHTQSNTHFVVETREEIFQREYQTKQEEYEKMTAKPSLPDSSELFKEKVTDEGTLTNIDELIAKYEQERKRDMDVHMPPVGLETQSSSTGTNTLTTQPSAFEKLLLEKLESLEKRLEKIEQGQKQESTEASEPEDREDQEKPKSPV